MRSRNRPADLSCLWVLAALSSPLCVAAPLAPLAVPSDDFESYTVGPLAGQGDWYSPNNTGQGLVVAAAIAGKSARVYCVADPTFTYSIGRVFTPDYGVLSVTVQAPPTTTYFLIGPGSDPNPSSGFLDPHGSVIIDATRELWIYQRNGTGGAYVPLGGGIAENEIVRLSWDLRNDGSVRLFRNGRLHFVGQSEVVTIAGAMRPIGSFFTGCGNNVPRSDNAARDVLTIDNLGASVPAVSDPVGQSDLVLVASLAHRALGGAVVAGAGIGIGASQPIQFIAVNSGAAASAGVRFLGTLPDGFSLGSSDCGIVQTGASWTSSDQTVAAGGSFICRAQLTRGALASPDLVAVTSTLTSTTVDPYPLNNEKTVFAEPGAPAALFANGFE